MAFSICYVWEDTDTKESEPKFGDHFSDAETLDEAFEETRRYVRGTLSRQKYKVDKGRVLIRQLWDVTEYAKLHDKFGKHKKIDDTIRPAIGHRLQGDVHTIDCDELIIRVNKELIKHKQPLPVAGLSQNQFDAATNVITAIAGGKRTIVAELCARFGKTIWSGALIRETGVQLTIVASYVLTSFSSFKKDLTSFEQFKDFVLVDSKDDDYQAQVTDGLTAGSQVVVFVSMCGGGRRQDRIDYLFGLDVVRLVVIDEADFGVHQVKQSKPLIDARGENDVVILMTGTNGDKAASVWSVDHYLSVTYPELIIEKRLTEERMAVGA